MELTDSVELVAGVPVIVVTPALVELAKGAGLPVRLAGIAAVVVAGILLVIAEIALNGVPASEEMARTMSRWTLGAVVYGMAAAGLYSQGRSMAQREMMAGR
jgi:hypothetical protein